MESMTTSKAVHLIVLGAQKSGTTWLQHVLDSNENFFCPAIRQEVSFFTNYWEKGFDYYLNLYKDAHPNQVTVDVSPRYQEVATTPERIHEFTQKTSRKVKLVLICREPLARLESAYKMYIQQGYHFENMKDAVQKTPDLIEKGLYFKTVKKYLPYFKQEDVLILFFDDLKSQSDSLLDKIRAFAQIEETITNTYESIKINSGGKPKFLLLKEMVRYSGRTLRYLGLTKLIHKIKKSTVIQKVQKANAAPFVISNEDQEYLKTLKPLFAEDVAQFEEWSKVEGLAKRWGYETKLKSNAY